MKNGCIFLISARKNLLFKCLELLDKNYNYQFNYPILIFYHGTKYDDIQFQESIRSINSNTKYSFHKINAEIPSHLSKNDMFWNLKNNRYASKFGKDRIGYLHANYFWNNFMNFKELKQYDYLIRIDDDSWFKDKMEFDMFDELDKSGKLCGCAYSWNFVHHRVIETRQNLFSWIKKYVNNYKVDVKNKLLKKYLEEEENDIVDNIKCNKNFHSMNYLCGNCNIYNRKLFDNKEWKQYLDEFNKIAGGYRYRWGDCEIISLFYYIHIGDDFLDLDLINRNLYHNQLDNVYHCVKDKDLKY